MKKIFAAVILLSALIGGVAGFALGIFVYPFWFLRDIVATETLPDAATRKAVAQGRFVHVNRADPIHWGRGTVTVYLDLVRMAEDFEVGPGPKYHVYLVAEPDVTTKTDVPRTRFIDLGRLRAFKGSQNYAVPAGVSTADYASVVIWCEQFGVLISPASLKGIAQ
jgi:hypothetical protein